MKNSGIVFYFATDYTNEEFAVFIENVASLISVGNAYADCLIAEKLFDLLVLSDKPSVALNEVMRELAEQGVDSRRLSVIFQNISMNVGILSKIAGCEDADAMKRIQDAYDAIYTVFL